MATLSWPDRETPAPGLVAAWYVLNRLPVGRVPWWAAEWLADGQDGPALRELAGLGVGDSREVRDLLPAALAETGTTILLDRLDAVSVWFCHVARIYLDGAVDERWVAQWIGEIVGAAGHDTAVQQQPLGGVFGVFDAWAKGCGPSNRELRATIQAACREQLQMPHLPPDRKTSRWRIWLRGVQKRWRIAGGTDVALAASDRWMRYVADHRVPRPL